MRRTITIIMAAVLVAGMFALPASGDSSTETLDLVGQGFPSDNVVGTAELTRLPNGLTVRVTMQTPEPGSYSYPDGAADDGGPEAFSLWAFVFADPSQCVDGCSGLADVAASGGGVFNVAGHISGGGKMVLSGHISKNSDPFALNQLTNAATAEVHVAVAPHGTLDPSQLPAQITTPIGSPPVWWIALFK